MTSALSDHLQSIYDEHGELTPALVVSQARLADHPLHDRFDWDDSSAAEKYRQVQAGELIRSVRVRYKEDEGGPVYVRKFHSVNRAEGATYMPVEEIREDDFTRKLVLQAAERELKSLMRKYGHLEEFMNLLAQQVA